MVEVWGGQRDKTLSLLYLAGDLALLGQGVESALDCRFLDAKLREHVGDALVVDGGREKEEERKRE